MARNDSQTKLHILDTTEKALSECNSKDLHLQSISARANVGIQTIYYHFESREQLIAEVQHLVFVKTLVPLKTQLDNAEVALAKLDKSEFVSAIAESFHEMGLSGEGGNASNIVQLMIDMSTVPRMNIEVAGELNLCMNRWISLIQDSVALGWIDESTDVPTFVTMWWSMWWGRAAISHSEVLAPSMERVRGFLLSAIGVKC